MPLWAVNAPPNKLDINDKTGRTSSLSVTVAAANDNDDRCCKTEGILFKWKIKRKYIHEDTAICSFLGQRDSSGLLLPSTCIVMVSLSLSSTPCVSQDFYLAAKVTNLAVLVLPVTSFLLPPSHNPSVMFSIFWECQCATCWHCAWMLTRLYIVIENRIPSLPWLLTKIGSNVVQIRDLTVFSSILM